MSMKYLGKHFDIHTGGVDHIPVHHTNEIAQSEGSFSEQDRSAGPWVNYWLHNAFLVIEGATKMSKSSGNFLTLQSLVDKGYDPLDYRYFLLGAHYRSPANFSWNSMDSAKNSRASLVKRAAKVLEAAGGKAAASLGEKAAEHLQKFTAAMENDLGTPAALGVLQTALKDGDVPPAETLLLMQKMDAVLGLKLEECSKESLKKPATEINSHEGDPEAAQIDALVAERTAAKKAKDFARADQIRDELAARGITIIDTPNGVMWKRN